MYVIAELFCFNANSPPESHKGQNWPSHSRREIFGRRSSQRRSSQGKWDQEPSAPWTFSMDPVTCDARYGGGQIGEFWSPSALVFLLSQDRLPNRRSPWHRLGTSSSSQDQPLKFHCQRFIILISPLNSIWSSWGFLYLTSTNHYLLDSSWHWLLMAPFLIATAIARPSIFVVTFSSCGQK